MPGRGSPGTRVKLMTLHSSKGLQYQVGIIAGAECLPWRSPYGLETAGSPQVRAWNDKKVGSENRDQAPAGHSGSGQLFSVEWECVPELSRFLGIVIAMYYRDHPPPQFHAIYAEHEATIDVETGEVNGYLPARVLELVQEWRLLHQAELREAWSLAVARKPLPNIAPLE